LPVWCQDEGGPYQAIPQPGASWQPKGKAALQPHEYIRGGTAKLLVLFRPATGQVRAEPVERAPNEVLHPWLKGELKQILATLPPPPAADDLGTLPEGRWWCDWGWSKEQIGHWRELPPIRMILIWDNLAGHHTWEMVRWCVEHGILLLYTPLSGSWLNMAESLLRILGRRALAGQHPKDAVQAMEWLAATVRGWNVAPTPFEWGGKRAERRQRARERRHKLGASGAYTRRPLPRGGSGTAHPNPCFHAN
jgi:DDE superfamily endonuclease